MLIGFLFVGVSVIVVSMLVALESALVQVRRPFLSARASAGESREDASLCQISTAEFVAAARVLTGILMLLCGAFLGRAWGLYLSSSRTGTASALSSSQYLAHYVAALFAGGVIICAILVGAYLLPTQLGARFADRVITALSPFGVLVVRLLLPVMLVSKLIARLGSVGEGDSGAVEEEALEEGIRSLVEEGERAGVIEEEEREIISRVFKLGDKPVVSIMTPRSDVVFLNASMSCEEALERVLEARHTSYPVLNSEENDVVGVASSHDIFDLQRLGAQSPGELKAIVSTAIDVPESMTALELLELFKEQGGRFAIVRDEYGMIAGIATVGDVLQVIVGELGDSNGEERSVVKRDDGSLLVDAASDVENLFELLGLKPQDDEEEAPFHSVGGFVMASLGRIPKEGEAFVHAGFRFEVVDMDGKRIDKVLVARCEARSAVGE
jgi:putative hemolysin